MYFELQFQKIPTDQKFLQVNFSFRDLFEDSLDFINMFSQISSSYLKEALVLGLTTAKCMQQENSVFIHLTTFKHLHWLTIKKKNSNNPSATLNYAY